MELEVAQTRAEAAKTSCLKLSTELKATQECVKARDTLIECQKRDFDAQHNKHNKSFKATMANITQFIAKEVSKLQPNLHGKELENSNEKEG